MISDKEKDFDSDLWEPTSYKLIRNKINHKYEKKLNKSNLLNSFSYFSQNMFSPADRLCGFNPKQFGRGSYCCNTVSIYYVCMQIEFIHWVIFNWGISVTSFHYRHTVLCIPLEL